MKIIFNLLLSIVLLANNAFAWSGLMQGKWNGNSAWRNEASDYSAQQRAGFGYLPSGLTFYKDFSKSITGDANSLTADYSIGSPIATFTRTGGNASYIDASGYVKFVTASNTPRITYGTYSESGWTLFDTNGKLLKGLMIESAMTNRATYCNTPENAAWTKTNITADNDDASSTSPDGTATAPSLTASDANGTFTQAYTDASAGIYTASIFIKRKTGTGTINLRANTSNSYTNITANVKNYWTRIPVSSTSLTNPTFDLQIVTSGDAVYIWNPQLEKNPYMTSPIPSLTTAVARGAEVLKYAIAGNRTAEQETIVIKFTPAQDGTAYTANGYLTDTDTKSRIMVIAATADKIIFRPNSSDSGASTLTGATAILANTSYIYAGIAVGTTGNPNVQLYLNGVSDASNNNTDYTAPAWGNYFYVGADSDGTRQLEGYIAKIMVFNRQLSLSEALSASSLL